MAPPAPASLGGSGVRALWTGREAGDQRQLISGSEAPPPVAAGRTLRRMSQLHGSRVLIADAPGIPGVCDPWPEDESASPGGDAVISTGPTSCLAVLTADCAPLALASSEGFFAAVHVGWRGLLAGVVERTLDAMTAVGATGLEAGLGPCIHPCCYGFDASRIDLIARRFGSGVKSRTALGEPALDLPRAVRNALQLRGIDIVAEDDRCSACTADSFSFRARRDEQRQALLVWYEHTCEVQHHRSDAPGEEIVSGVPA